MVLNKNERGRLIRRRAIGLSVTSRDMFMQRIHGSTCDTRQHVYLRYTLCGLTLVAVYLTVKHRNCALMCLRKPLSGYQLTCRIVSIGCALYTLI